MPWKPASAEYQRFVEAYDVIQTWKPESDVYAFKHFPLVTGVAGALAGAYVNGFYRKKVKLRNKVLISTGIPMIFLPVFVGTVLHHQFVQRPLILQSYQCPVCIEVRGGAMQLFAGFIYPMVMGPAITFHFASTLYTYPIPSMKEPKQLWELYLKFTKPALPRLSILAGIQMAVGMALTHVEAHNYFTVLCKVSVMAEHVKDYTPEN